MATYAANTLMGHYVLQQILCTACILLFALIRPYKRGLYNFVDTSIFSILATINVLVMYNLYLETIDCNLSKPAYYTVVALLFLPLVYMVTYTLHHLCQTYQSACYKKMAEGIKKLRKNKWHLFRRKTVTSFSVDDEYDQFMDIIAAKSSSCASIVK